MTEGEFGQIENTSNRDPLVHLLGAMADDAVGRRDGQTGLSRYVTGMEAAGQWQVVGSEMVPFDGHEQLKELGFTFGQRPGDDDLFISCAMPNGWAKQPTDHSMWSKIVDQRGIERVGIFYKAAFYDRRAFCRVTRVGESLASDRIYAEGTPSLPACWTELTDTERAEYAAALHKDLERERKVLPFMAENEEDKALCESHIERVQALITLIPTGDERTEVKPEGRVA